MKKPGNAKAADSAGPTRANFLKEIWMLNIKKLLSSELNLSKQFNFHVSQKSQLHRRGSGSHGAIAVAPKIKLPW